MTTLDIRVLRAFLEKEKMGGEMLARKEFIEVLLLEEDIISYVAQHALC